MILPEWVRLLCYIAIAVLPVWIDFFTKSTDYTLRGLAMPTLSSLLTAFTVILARTKSSIPDSNSNGSNEPPPPRNP